MKLIAVIIFICSSQYSFCQDSFFLDVKIFDSGIINKLYLKVQDRYSKNKFEKIDSCIIQNNSFFFSGTIPGSSETALLIVKKEDGILNKFIFILDSGFNHINISKPFEIGNLFLSVQRPKSLSNLIYSRIDSVQQLFTAKFGTYVENLTTGGKIWVLNDIDKINELKQIELNILKQYPSSFYSLIHLYELLHSSTYRRSPSDLMNTFKKLDSNLRKTSLGKEFYATCNYILSAERESKIGHVVRNFKVKNDKGNLFNNISLLGNPYIIAFSATWCIPCKYYEKKLKELYEKYDSRGLKVIYFNLDDNVKKWKEHIESDGLEWINVSERTKFENSKIAKVFNVSGIPVYILVDRSGHIAYNSDELLDVNFEKLESSILDIL